MDFVKAQPASLQVGDIFLVSIAHSSSLFTALGNTQFVSV